MRSLLTSYDFVSNAFCLFCSDVAAALDIAPYETFRGSARKELLRKKAGVLVMSSGGSSAMAHGVKYEDEARVKYEALTGDRVLEFGLMTHPDPDLAWLGGSPDGVSAERDRIVEIKCPVSRKIIPGHVPEHYMPVSCCCCWSWGQCWRRPPVSCRTIRPARRSLSGRPQSRRRGDPS